jgi:hypothetical protein
MWMLVVAMGKHLNALFVADRAVCGAFRRAAKTNNVWNRLVRRGSIARRVCMYGMNSLCLLLCILSFPRQLLQCGWVQCRSCASHFYCQCPSPLHPRVLQCVFVFRLAGSCPSRLYLNEEPSTVSAFLGALLDTAIFFKAMYVISSFEWLS